MAGPSDYETLQKAIKKLAEEVKCIPTSRSEEKEKNEPLPGMKFGPMAHIGVVCSDDGQKLSVDVLIHLNSFESPDMVDDVAFRYFIQNGIFVRNKHNGPANVHFEKRQPGKPKTCIPIAVQTLEAWTRTHYPAHQFSHCSCNSHYHGTNLGHDDNTCRGRGLAAFIAESFWNQKSIDGLEIPEKFL